MTPEENALLARLDGKQLIQFGKKMYYDDLNNLMPLAWNNNIGIIAEHEDGDGNIIWSTDVAFNDYFMSYFDKDPKTAIQQALLAIARDKFSDSNNT